MASKEVTLLYSTMGELIQKYRYQAGLTISELARQSGIHKGVISRIEQGETRRPELKTMLPIAKVLEIPTIDILEYYVDVEQRPDVLFDLMREAIDLSAKPLLSKIALRYLQTPYDQSYLLIARLFDFTETITDTSIQLSLYDVIVKYAREHGIQQFLAKGLLQKYLIERYEFNRLNETFYNGREILNYTDFLSPQEKVTLYYRMSLHAYALNKYESCIELGKLGHSEDTSTNELKERVALAICNSYMFLGNFSALNEHLSLYEKLNYKFIIERLNLFRAFVLSRTGNYTEAIPLLKESLKDVTESNRIYRVNELLEALFHVNDLHSIEEMIETEEKKFLLLDNDPNQYSGLGKYFRLKGTLLMKLNSFDRAMEAYLKSLYYYAQISAFKELAECSDDIFSYHYLHQRNISLDLLEKLKKVYNVIVTKNKLRSDEK